MKVDGVNRSLQVFEIINCIIEAKILTFFSFEHLILQKLNLKGYCHEKNHLSISACALISNRNFILLDEPTALLDQTSQLKVLKTIKNLTSDHKKPLSALWITHRYEELSYADAVAELKNGFLSSWKKPSKFQYN